MSSLKKKKRFIVLKGLMLSHLRKETKKLVFIAQNHFADGYVEKRTVKSASTSSKHWFVLNTVSGVRKSISKKKYESLLKEHGSKIKTVEKVRFRFFHGSRHINVDFLVQKPFGIIIDIEVKDDHKKIVFPPEWILSDVTDHPDYTDASIAGSSKENVSAKK